MKLIDLTHPVGPTEEDPEPVSTEHRDIRPAAAEPYVAVVHNFRHNGMVGTYVDFPGHIVATDDGADAANYPPEKLFRVPAAVIHLDRPDGSGAVTAEELAAACPQPPSGGGLIVNALGTKRFDAIEERSVWLGSDAVEWIAGTGAHILVSDIYESRELHGVFAGLFGAGISTVCYPVRLHELTAEKVLLTVLFARVPGAKQLPCRVLAEVE